MKNLDQFNFHYFEISPVKIINAFESAIIKIMRKKCNPLPISLPRAKEFSTNGVFRWNVF